jgi:hypothetical protein
MTLQGVLGIRQPPYSGRVRLGDDHERMSVSVRLALHATSLPDRRHLQLLRMVAPRRGPAAELWQLAMLAGKVETVKTVS